MTSLSRTEENYLKAIYKNMAGVEMVSTNAIATEIQIKAASVTDMLKKLKLKKLIYYKSYEGCKLTKQGLKTAIEIIRRHRLWETFLCKCLGYEWNEVHEIAEELEHIGSPNLIDRLDSFLGFPKIDPHGDVIPDVNGAVIYQESIPLFELLENEEAVVVSVNSHEQGILELLNHYQISLGSTIKIIKRFQYDESIECIINNQSICVLAKSISLNVSIVKK